MKRFPDDIIYLYRCVHRHIIYEVSIYIKGEKCYIFEK